MQEEAMDGVRVKQEIIERLKLPETSRPKTPSVPLSVIDLSSSDSDSAGSSSSSDGEGSANGTSGKRSRSSNGVGGGLSKKKKKKMEKSSVALPAGFLDPLPPKNAAATLPGASPRAQPSAVRNGGAKSTEKVEKCKQFWKAGDFEGVGADWDTSTGGMDHLRVHPKFLHSNATSHKWVLGAFAELLDNSLDEVCNGATYVNIDMLKNKKDGCKMLLIEDNGGGMDPDKMRQCMSLGYSVKSKIADTIGQYGNGFKTSTMRLGADVIVFSRCPGQNGKRSTQSIGLLSYTFLRSTGKEDIIVPTLNYEKGLEWNSMIRTSTSDWDRTVETIVQWSPFSSEADLLRQFNQMKDHGTRVIIYNLWEDDQGELELDFDTDPHDIQIRGVNRDENNIQKAKHYPNSKHFLTYRHSLRNYASILYLRVPPRFRIILRGKDVQHHNIVNDMMMTQEITYRPQPGADGLPKDSHLIAVVTIGFVKDAKHHIDVQGFNVYHKNRLIKPFWRVWNASGSDGRGVIGVLEANFVEPAHDKQGFERTIVLSRLETKLVQMQKTYWSSLCHKIGYAPRLKKNINDREGSPDYVPEPPSKAKGAGSNKKTPISASGKAQPYSSPTQERRQSERVRKTSDKGHVNGHVYAEGVDRLGTPAGRSSSSRPSSPSGENENGVHVNGFSPVSDSQAIAKLKEENRQLKEKLARKEEEILGDLLRELEYEKDKVKSLETKLEEATQKYEDLNMEQESLISIFTEERNRRDAEEESLREKLKDSSKTIQELVDKVKLLENAKSSARNNK